MAKDKQKNRDDEATEETAASGKMSRKKFDKKLTELQVELTRLQTWGTRPVTAALRSGSWLA